MKRYDTPQQMRDAANVIIELTKGFSGEPTDVGMIACLEMTDCVLQLTNGVLMHPKEKIAEYTYWISNNWFIPIKDGLWVVDVNNEEYEDTFKGYFTSPPILTGEELFELFLKGKGTF